MKDINSSLNKSQIELRDKLESSLEKNRSSFDKNIEALNVAQKAKFEDLEAKQTKLLESNEKKLEEMRVTVDEKLQKTLNDRLSQSFETVGKQLQSVQEGLGEMKTLASDVGGLKKVLSNTKLRGGLGELQLSMILEQMLSPSQYEANVRTKKGSNDVVEYAIKLPGKEEGLDNIWLPIDAKFPKDCYETLVLAHEEGDATSIKAAHAKFDAEVLKMAKDISKKYIDPPYTTPFAVMFLPFEGIYAEVVRNSTLLDEIQKNHNIMVTGPTTLGAMLQSLQMGFRTLAIEKRSGEVWKVLGAVKNEFEKFGNLLTKTQKHFQSGLDELDNLVGTRSNVIRNKLKSVETLPDSESKLILPENSEVLEEV